MKTFNQCKVGPASDGFSTKAQKPITLQVQRQSIQSRLGQLCIKRKRRPTNYASSAKEAAHCHIICVCFVSDFLFVCFVKCQRCLQLLSLSLFRPMLIKPPMESQVLHLKCFLGRRVFPRLFVLRDVAIHPSSASLTGFLNGSDGLLRFLIPESLPCPLEVTHLRARDRWKKQNKALFAIKICLDNTTQQHLGHEQVVFGEQVRSGRSRGCTVSGQ